MTFEPPFPPWELIRIERARPADSLWRPEMVHSQGYRLGEGGCQATLSIQQTVTFCIQPEGFGPGSLSTFPVIKSGDGGPPSHSAVNSLSTLAYSSVKHDPIAMEARKCTLSSSCKAAQPA